MLKYTPKQSAEIRRVVKNYNAKLARLKKKGTNVKLPEKIKTKEIKQIASSRPELRRMINDYKKFSKRGSEKAKDFDNFSITKWEYNKVLREKRKAKRLVDEELEFLETKTPEVFGKKQATTFAKMGSSQYRNYKIKKQKLDRNINDLNFDEFKNFKNFINRTSKLDKQKATFKENYLTMLEQNAYFYEQDKNKANKIYNYIYDLDDEEFYEFFRTDKGVQATLDYYKLIHDIGENINDKNMKNDTDNLIDSLYEMI